MLLSRRHGLTGAVRRLTTGENDLPSDPPDTGSARSRSVEIARTRTMLHRAYWHLAQMLEARPENRVSRATHRSDPLAAPWFEQHLRSRACSPTDDEARRIIVVALENARQWCAVGGPRQDRLLSDLSCWYDSRTRGRPALDVVNLRRRLRRANAYVGIALYRTIIASPATARRETRSAPHSEHVIRRNPLGLTPDRAARGRSASGGVALRARRTFGAGRARLLSQVRCNFKGCHTQVDLVLLAQ